jgi:hypothetical protein
VRVLVIVVVIVVLIVLDGVRLASVIRSAKAPAARALHPRDFTAVAAALSSFPVARAQSGIGHH